MDDRSRHTVLLTAAFEELTLAVAGVVASHDVPDDATWDLARVIDHVHRKALAELKVSTPAADRHDDSQNREHPAIARLLRQLRGGGDC